MANFAEGEQFEWLMKYSEHFSEFSIRKEINAEMKTGLIKQALKLCMLAVLLYI